MPRSMGMIERKRGVKRSRLSVKQQIFVDALLADRGFSVAKAAIAAGYKKSCAGPAGTKLLKHPLVAATIGREIYERRQKYKLDAGRVLEELMCIGFFNPKRLLDSDGVIMELKDLPDEVAAAVKKITVKYEEGEDGETTCKHITIEFWDKMEALQLLAKHLGLLLERQQTDLREGLNWDALYQRERDVVDVVEARILALEAEASIQGDRADQAISVSSSEQ